MCGIAGYYNKTGAPVGHTAPVLQMLDLQKHRGPDDRGVCAFSLQHQEAQALPVTHPTGIDNQFDGIVGFNRLSILDLSSNGHQPMPSADGKVVLAFNGEIYNAFDFKSELEAGGYHFKSKSDTEVILALYLKYGFDEMIRRLNGMFAIVLIDTSQQVLYLARDRFGIKPLYVHETGDMLAFTSEIKSLFALPEFKPQLNIPLMDEFLIFRNVVNDTLLKGVRGLTPGTYLEYRPGGLCKTHSFFDVSFLERQPHTGSLGQSVDRLESAFANAIRRQLISDVKLGCQLSGGIDSSLVTWQAKKQSSNGMLETVSIVLDDVRFNETPYIDQVASTVDVKSHRFKLEPGYYLQHLEKATWHFENPINHPNTLGIYLLSQRAREYVTVLLSGEGADEVFGGYDRFASAIHPFHWRNFARSLKKCKGSYRAWMQQHRNAASRGIWASAYLSSANAGDLIPGFDLDRALERRLNLYDTLRGKDFDRLIKYEMKTYLPDLLIRQDKMSMAHSIENRVPFLDNEMVDAAFTLPISHLLGSANEQDTKLVLKEMATRVFGEPFARRPKQGFGIPLRAFFLEKEFQQYLLEVTMPGIKGYGLFDHQSVLKKIQRVATLSVQDLDSLWIAISFEVWRRQFFEVLEKHEQANSYS